MNTINMNGSILEYLKSFQIDPLTCESSDRKYAQIGGSASILRAIGSARNDFQAQPDWPQAMSAIIRNELDDRDRILTILPNQDTIAALLAIRLGINMHLAVALAYDDIIHAVDIDRCCSAEYDGTDFTGLATFARPGESESTAVLMVRQDVKDFVLRFAPEELAIFDQRPIEGLYQPFRTSYFEEHFVADYTYRTDERIFLSPSSAATLPGSAVLNAVAEDLRNTIYKPGPSLDRATMEREMRQQVQGIIDKHLGSGMGRAIVQLPAE